MQAPGFSSVGMQLLSAIITFMGGILTFGIGLQLNRSVCSAAILLCIAFYATSKFLVYLYLIERVHIVWAPPVEGRRRRRLRSPVDIICFITVSAYTVIIALLIAGRISLLRDGDETCVIGLKALASIPLLTYDLASLVGLTTSTINIAVLYALKGHELGWICLGSCGVDVTLNSYALYWATGLRSRRRSRASSLTDGQISRDLNMFATKNTANVEPTSSRTPLSMPLPTKPPGHRLHFHLPHPHFPHLPHLASRTHHNAASASSLDPAHNPFAPPVFVPKLPQSEIHISANPGLAERSSPVGILKSFANLFRDDPEARSSATGNIEVTVTTHLAVEHEDMDAGEYNELHTIHDTPTVCATTPIVMADLVDSMLDLMRRLPPTRTEENVASLIQICPDYADDLLGSVDQPLQLMTDRATGREFLACDYNRDGESYRSPWSNEYDPPLEDGTVPSPKLRKLEVSANDAFDTYREMYYEGGVSSVYFWDLDDGGFAGVVLLKKSEFESCAFSEFGVLVDSLHTAMTPTSSTEPSGSWDSIHVFETVERGRQAHYKLTSTVMLQLTMRKASDDEAQGKEGWKRDGEVTLGGSMTRQTEQDWPIHDSSSHITNIGKMIEEMEIKMRNLLQEVYFGKTRDIIYDLRSVDDLEKTRRQRELQKELVGFMKR
ncbi:hypothetical protein D9757_002542 [Collybiopsis confluens]|uniref:F-actin-capping protein subunit beta n=1 Tax=Collybiopsis confluens TaxID=2823264 RepID=A0A8H5HXX0_9AGAR|nr:hypothetical protein D9757_002542 [Collybiopsis confluens]